MSAPRRLEFTQGDRLPSIPEAMIAITWCGPGAVELRALELSKGDEVYRYPIQGVRLGQGEETVHRVAFRGIAGDHGVEVQATAADRSIVTARTIVSLVEVPFRDPYEACRACRGSWGSFGIGGKTMCDCRTRDGGRACRADRECEGTCVFERFEDVSPAELTCPPGETAKRAVGECSRRMLHFGCHAYMDSARAQCVSPGAEPRIQYLCVD